MLMAGQPDSDLAKDETSLEHAQSGTAVEASATSLTLDALEALAPFVPSLLRKDLVQESPEFASSQVRKTFVGGFQTRNVKCECRHAISLYVMCMKCAGAVHDAVSRRCVDRGHHRFHCSHRGSGEARDSRG